MSEVPQSPARQARFLRWLPLLASIAALATATPLAWSKGFGTFLLTVMVYLPLVLVLCICLCIWAIAERRSPRGRPVRAALVALLVLIPLTFYFVPRVKDELSYLLWSTTHSGMIREFAGRDGIIADWESWGMAGMENDSYLVSNPDDKLGGPSEASKWLWHVGVDCEIVDTKRVARGLYIVTTSNCPLR